MKSPMTHFEPPSDFVEDSSSGGKKSYLKIAGIGCGVVMLIVAILFGVGAFRVVSCCGDVKDAGLRTAAAQQTAMSFGAEVRDGQFEAAHARLSDDYGGELTVAQLEQMYAPHNAILENSVMLAEGLQAARDVKEIGDVDKVQDWTISLRFYPRGHGEEALTTKLSLNLPAGQGEGAEARVTSVETELSKIEFESEAPALSVRELHGFLQAGNISRARLKLDPAMQKSQSREAFQAFIDEQGDLFTRSTMEVRDVRYRNIAEADVVAMLSSATGKKAIVTYQLTNNIGLWRINGITPLIESTEPATDLIADPPPTDEIEGEGGAKEGEEDAPKEEEPKEEEEDAPK